MPEAEGGLACCQIAALSVTWSPDAKWLATGSDDNTAQVWGTAMGRELFTLRGHGKGLLTDAFGAVAWSPDGKRLASAGADGIVQVYAMDIELLMSSRLLARHAQPDARRVP